MISHESSTQNPRTSSLHGFEHRRHCLDMQDALQIHSLTLCAMWHESQAKIMAQLGRNALAPRNVEYCGAQAGTHARWSELLKIEAQP